MIEIRGIDVSKHNGTINWSKVAADGIKFAIVRVGYGSKKGTPTKDPKFAANIDGALSAGLHVGTYLYSYALDAANARLEAKFVLNEISKHAGRMHYPVFFDIEDQSQAALGKVKLSAMCEAFCDAVQDAGWIPGIYASLDWVKNKINAATIAKYDLWLAQWSSKPTYTGNIALWQHSDKGKVNGISGGVDMNISYVDYPDMASGVVTASASPTKARPTLRKGSTGPAVREAQTALNRRGLSLVVDGAFGAQTYAAVRAFQKNKGLAADGVIGPKTHSALEEYYK